MPSSELAEDEEEEGQCRDESTPIASPSAGQACPELGEIVASWSVLDEASRRAVLAVVRAARKGGTL
ncbi:MAG: hypothetical protein AAGA96_13925 [Verrucomicrobiota bacterium]